MTRTAALIVAIAATLFFGGVASSSAAHHAEPGLQLASADVTRLERAGNTSPPALQNVPREERLFVLPEMTYPKAAPQKVAAGKVPLREVLKRLKRKYDGKHLSAAERNGTYRIKWKMPNGNVRLIVVDTKTGREI